MAVQLINNVKQFEEGLRTVAKPTASIPTIWALMDVTGWIRWSSTISTMHERRSNGGKKYSHGLSEYLKSMPICFTLCPTKVTPEADTIQVQGFCHCRPCLVSLSRSRLDVPTKPAEIDLAAAARPGRQPTKMGGCYCWAWGEMASHRLWWKRRAVWTL